MPAESVRRWTALEVRERIAERLAWKPFGASAPMELELPAFFARVHGESV